MGDFLLTSVGFGPGSKHVLVSQTEDDPLKTCCIEVISQNLCRVALYLSDWMELMLPTRVVYDVRGICVPLQETHARISLTLFSPSALWVTLSNILQLSTDVHQIAKVMNLYWLFFLLMLEFMLWSANFWQLPMREIVLNENILLCLLLLVPGAWTTTLLMRLSQPCPPLFKCHFSVPSLPLLLEDEFSKWSQL